MIFVSVGTVSFPFPRLVNSVIEIFALEQKEMVIIQAGNYRSGKVPRHIQLISYLPLAQMMQNYEAARWVISAAGEASVFLMLKYCRNKPILFPRRKKFGEHVDDQQMEIAKKAVELDIAWVAWNNKDLRKSINLKPDKLLFNNQKQTSTRAQLLSHLSQIL